MLELVMIVVIALAKSEPSEQEGVARAALGGVRLPADGVTGAINKKGAVLQHDDARDPSNQERAQGADPSIPEKADRCREGRS